MCQIIRWKDNQCAGHIYMTLNDTGWFKPCRCNDNWPVWNIDNTAPVFSIYSFWRMWMIISGLRMLASMEPWTCIMISDAQCSYVISSQSWNESSKMAKCPECGTPMKKCDGKDKYYCERSTCSVISVCHPDKPSFMKITHNAKAKTPEIEKQAQRNRWMISPRIKNVTNIPRAVRPQKILGISFLFS